MNIQTKSSHASETRSAGEIHAGKVQGTTKRRRSEFSALRHSVNAAKRCTRSKIVDKFENEHADEIKTSIPKILASVILGSFAQLIISD